MPYVESHESFCQKHGQPIRDGSVELYRDGAQIRTLGEELFQLLEPPAAKRELLEARHRYHVAWLSRIEEAFDRIKATAMGADGVLSGGWLPIFGPDPVGPKERLLHLKKLADEHKAEIATIEAELNTLPEVKAAAERQRMVAELEQRRREAIAKHRSEIEAITL